MHTFHLDVHRDYRMPLTASAYKYRDQPGAYVIICQDVTIHQLTPQEIIELGMAIANEGWRLQSEPQKTTPPELVNPMPLSEAMFDPAAFVDGMTEEQKTNVGIPEDLLDPTGRIKRECDFIAHDTGDPVG